MILHFFTGRQIFYVAGLIFYGDSTATNACVTAADLDGNLHCFVRPLSSCCIKYLLCRSAGFSWLFSIWTHSCSVFFRLTTCTCWTACDWVSIDADWHRLKQQKQESGKKTLIWNWLRQQPHSTQVVHCLQIVRCWLWLTRQFAAASSAAISWWHYEQEMLPARFQETAQSEQHWHSDADIDYQQMYNSFEYALRMGAKGLFCSAWLQWFNFFSLPKFTFSLHEFRVRFRV